MKPIKNPLIGLFIIGGLVALAGFIEAQVETASAQSGSVNTVPPDSVVQIAAEAQGLSLASPDQIPPDRCGTFWIVTGDTFPAPWPYLPARYDLASTPIFSLGPNADFLVDGTGGVAPQPTGDEAVLGITAASLLQAQGNMVLDFIAQMQAAQVNAALTQGQRQMMAMDDSGPPSPGDGGDGGDGGTNGYSGFSQIIIDYGTNLWIADFALSSNTAAGIVTNTQADVSYEIQYSPDLLATQWSSAGFVLGSELTNWTSMTVTNVNVTNNTFFRIRSWADDGSGLPIWWQLQYFNTTGVDPYGNPMGDGWNNLYKFQHGMNPNQFYTPAAPPALTLFVDSTGTNVALSWQSSSGNVSYYEVDEGYYSFSSIGTVPAGSPTTFGTTLGQVYFGTEQIGPGFQVIAHYTNGATSASAVVRMTPSNYPTGQAQVFRNSQGHFELLTGNLPSDATLIRLFWVTNSFPYQYGYYDVSPSNLVNGLYQLPDSFAGVFADYIVFIDILHQSGKFDYANDISLADGDAVNPPDWSAWINTSARYLKNNLHFLLGSATVNHSFSFESTYQSPYENETLNRPETGPAYEYSGYHYYESTWGEFWNEVFRPMEENFLWRNFAYVEGDLNTGIFYDWGNLEREAGDAGYGIYPEYQIQGGDLPPNAVSSPLLADATATNFFCRPNPGDPTYNAQLYADTGLSVNGNGYLSLPTGVRNVYGLPILSVKDAAGDEIDAGAGAVFTWDQFSGNWYMGTAPLSLATVDYYFASQTPHDYYGFPLTPGPGEPGFSPTNTMPLLIAGMNGWPCSVMGWAKQAIQNGYNGQFAYLEQFFDQAYTEDSNGVATTNSAGVLSAYGNFFPTYPGPAALVTMPDIDTGQRGTGTVWCVSLALDKNHDGTMDLSWNGPDATSQASPMVCWVNNGYTVAGAGGALDKDLSLPPNHPEYANYVGGKVTCQRDLENFFRLWICGMPQLPSSQGYAITLGITSLSGNPAINLYMSSDSAGGTGYLTDTNVAAEQARTYASPNPTWGVALATINAQQSYTLPSNFFDYNYPYFSRFLFEGAGIGLGQLTMTITQNGNTIAQASAWLDFHDIKDLYEQAHATNVTSGLPPSSLISQLVVDHATVAASDETKQAIVFVHGINNTEFNYYDSTETIFKRLYWSGYHGKVAGFRWPCAYLPFDNTLNPFNYDRGEFYAWKSASALKDYLNYLKNRPDLTNYAINIFAHSQGNVVASEAIKEGAPFDNYILTQGAIPAHCYDTSVPFLQKFLNAETNSPTPLYTTNGGYNGYFVGLSGNLINFYNTNDYALVSGTWLGLQANWEQDQLLQKPDNFVYMLGPEYTYYPSTGTSIRTIINDEVVTDPQEIMSMVARSRTHAVGAQVSVGGVMNTNATVDLFNSFKFSNTRDDHSAQFTWPIQRVWGYYDQVLRSYRIQPITR